MLAARGDVRVGGTIDPAESGGEPGTFGTSTEPTARGR
jgi:hypothetical protein